MIPAKLKTLIGQYCMGINPTDEQLDEIMGLAVSLNADSAEVSEYIQKMVSGPNKEEREAASKRRAAQAKIRREKEKGRKAEKERIAAQEKADFEEAINKAIMDAKEPYVDLGLSVKWATTNVGASSPEEYGDYFAWGETIPKTRYSWSEYKLSEKVRWQVWDEEARLNKFLRKYDSDGTSFRTLECQCLNRYCTDKDNGDIDDILELKLDDDAATAYMKKRRWWRFWEIKKWRTPTEKEWKELEDKCQWRWTCISGTNGYLVTAKNGKSIFLPAAGFREKLDHWHDGEALRYWSSSLNKELPLKAIDFTRTESGYVNGNHWGSYRCFGMSIRAVKG